MMYALKKYLRKPLTVSLTLGASLILGLLSFGGMFTLLPVLSVSIAAFVLSVMYEGEIYQRNIENALAKLLDDHYAAELLGEAYLDSIEELTPEAPERQLHFFRMYFKLKQIDDDENSHPSASRAKRLKLMRIWLGQLIINQEARTPYAQTVFASIQEIDTWQSTADTINRRHRYIQAFAATAGALMSLGTVYLILDVLPALPFISIAPAALPFVVLPMAIISGIAYGFLSYNSLTDFLLKGNLSKWWEKAKSAESITFKIFCVFIFSLNITLTVFTAGTWLTVVNASNTTWKWLKSPLIKFASYLLTPVVSISTLGFNLENTLETIKEVDKSMEKKTANAQKKPVTKTNPETKMQWLNPFRILHKITFTPLLMLLFLGHLVSIGLTADRMPGIPAIVSALAGMVSEGFEDLHYFFDIDNLAKRIVNFGQILFSPFKALSYLVFRAYSADSLEAIFTELKTIMTAASLASPSDTNTSHAHHHHEHSAIPTKILELIFSPLFGLSALWHWSFQDNKSKKSLTDCYRLQTGSVEECVDHAPFQNVDDLWFVEEVSITTQAILKELNLHTTEPAIVKALNDLKQQKDLKEIKNFIQQSDSIGKVPELTQHLKHLKHLITDMNKPGAGWGNLKMRDCCL
ncbi:MAG: hypothetical protein EBY16_01495 [Gammaproteobacteria bacterium]|nr:hypothetical protein [Gammaproteobacteria bacterium]